MQGQTPFNSLLFTSSNLTDNQAGPTDYASCAAEEPISNLGTLVPTDQLQTLSGEQGCHALILLHTFYRYLDRCKRRSKNCQLVRRAWPETLNCGVGIYHGGPTSSSNPVAYL